MNDDELIEAFQVIFTQGARIENKGEFIGMGLFQTDLESHGFTKRELKDFCSSNILRKVTTRWQGGLRNTYVLLK